MSENLPSSDVKSDSGSSGQENLSPVFEWMRHHRLPLLMLFHLAVFSVVFYGSLIVRFESWFPAHAPNHFWVGLPLVASIQLVVFYFTKNFHGWWRYVTFADLVSTAQSAVIATLVIFSIDYLLISDFQISRGAILIDCAFTILVLSVLRSVLRFWDERSPVSKQRLNRRPALMLGSTAGVAKLAHLVNSRTSLNCKVIGLVSQEKVRATRFSDISVVGHLGELSDLCKKHSVRTVYVPAGSLEARAMRELIDRTQDDNVQIHVVPELNRLLEGGTQIPVREVSVDDLLRRPPVELDQEAIRDMVAGKTVLVTGAGGSIGSELCRQLMSFSPDRLVMLGRGENRLYQINRELCRDFEGSTEILPVLASITDKRRMSEIMATHRPVVVFHAAAHKHVPLTESNVGEAVINNVLGTKVVADLADEYGVKKFVMVSTDKAVNPTSLMGCTKQIAERYCLALGATSETKFVVTRFGNVLGSAGSVVPLFKEQISRGGPITITDPRMTRFFMTIPEAAQLVVQAGSMGNGGEIYVLEMGEPVLIEDLARDMIRLGGLPANSIDIVYTGIRPGEKLYEELYYGDEQPLPTSHEKILTAYHREFPCEETRESVEQLVDLAYKDESTIRMYLRQLVPEFGVADDTHSSADVVWPHRRPAEIPRKAQATD
jgi:FlaA1/EpsC-like NDP-sugar epimerase